MEIWRYLKMESAIFCKMCDGEMDGLGSDDLENRICRECDENELQSCLDEKERNEVLDSMFSEPNYSHLNLKEKSVNIQISAEEQDAILAAYDISFHKMNEEKLQLLNQVIAKLKDEIHY